MICDVTSLPSRRSAENVIPLKNNDDNNNEKSNVSAHN